MTRVLDSTITLVLAVALLVASLTVSLWGIADSRAPHPTLVPAHAHTIYEVQ